MICLGGQLGQAGRPEMQASSEHEEPPRPYKKWRHNPKGTWELLKGFK